MRNATVLIVNSRRADKPGRLRRSLPVTLPAGNVPLASDNVLGTGEKTPNRTARLRSAPLFAYQIDLTMRDRTAGRDDCGDLYRSRPN